MAAADESRDQARMGVCSISRPPQILLTSLKGVAKMKPELLLYMLNMLHMWSRESDRQLAENAVGYVPEASYEKRSSQGS